MKRRFQRGVEKKIDSPISNTLIKNLECKNKILLNGMMKNESHIIHQLLISVANLVDAYCWIDTGSTDDSKEIFTNFFKERNIPGVLHDVEWMDDFGAQRTDNMEKAEKWIQENAQPGEQWWICLMDSDDRLVDKSISFDDANTKDELAVPTLIDKTTLSANLVRIDAKFVGMDMGRPVMVKYDPIVRWQWYCPRHEYLGLRDTDRPFSEQKEDKIYMMCRSAGARSKDPRSVYMDINSYMKWFRKNDSSHRDYNRNMNYSAQAFKGAGLYEEAERRYLLAADSTDTLENRYIAWYEAASCRIRSGKGLYDYKVDYYLTEAIELLPNRLEARWALVRRYRDRKCYNQGWGLAASFVDKRDNIKLFSLKLETYVYEWQYDDDAAVCLYHAVNCGSLLDRMTTCKSIWERLLAAADQKGIPQQDRDRMQLNVDCCNKEIDKINNPTVEETKQETSSTESPTNTENSNESSTDQQQQ